MVLDYSKIRRILIIRLSSIGDILLTTPLIRSIKKKYPDIQLDYVIKEQYYELVQNNPHLTNVYKYNSHSADKLAKDILLNSKTFEYVIDLQNNLRSKKITHNLHIPVLRFKKDTLKKFLLVQIKINRLKKISQIPLRYAESAGIELDSEGTEFITENRPDARLNVTDKYIGLCPGAKHFTKIWPKEYFIELGKKLEAQGYKILLFGGLEEAKVSNEISKHLNSSINLCGDSLLQAGANMKVCKAIYTNDSGTMHLASAIQVPVIAFFGSTVKEFGFYPYKSPSIVLEVKNLSCRPCSHIGRKSCPKIHFKCMREISPEMAFNALNNLWALR
jgi:heptosyltransferase-2